MEQLVNFIIRPPRADYSPKDDLLDDEFTLKDRRFKRKDIEVKNGKGIVLQCSHYVPYHLPEENHLPCVIYCHGNSGCRADASEAAIILLPSNITVFTLDFSGSGLSEGEHVTLGWNEKEDLRAVVDYLRAEGNVSLIGLWGRSMGAVTSLLYGVEDPSIAGMVLDSPFSNLVDLMMELVDTYKYPLPKFTVKLAIQHMRRVIKKKANFDIMDLDTIKVAKSSFVPALFGHATDDDFIHPHHSDRIYSSYSGDKNIIKFDGDHNSPRPQFYFDSITIFFHNVLNPPESAFDENFHHTVHDYFGTDNWEAINELEYDHNPIIVPSLEPRASSTEDALTQLRQRRPMSRTDVPPDVTRQDRLLGVEEDPSDTCPRASSSSSPGPSIPTAADDHYLGYQVDCLPDMPSSIEDEERMLMEAILMSLKESGIMQGEKDEASSVDGRKASTSLTVCNSTSTSDAADLVVESSTNNLSALPDTTVAEKITKSNNSLTNGVVQSSMDIGNSTQQTTDNMEGTSARVVVQKNSGGHILDGLVQKWSNLFRNNR